MDSSLDQYLDDLDDRQPYLKGCLFFLQENNQRILKIRRTKGVLNMEHENSRRFLAAFVDIEQALERIVKPGRYKPYYQLVEDAATMDSYVRDIATELKEYGDLRNAIVHERIDDEPIAEPHLKTVLRLEKIRSLLLSPPTVEEFIRNVIIGYADTPLQEVLKQMYKHNLSKIPIYQNGNQFLGLLTAEAIIFWLADHISDETKNLGREPVKNVLDYLDKPDNYYFVAKTFTMFEILQLFDSYGYEGKRLQAVLISSNGQDNGRLQGIITAFDLPRIYHVIES